MKKLLQRDWPVFLAIAAVALIFECKLQGNSPAPAPTDAPAQAGPTQEVMTCAVSTDGAGEVLLQCDVQPQSADAIRQLLDGPKMSCTAQPAQPGDAVVEVDCVVKDPSGLASLKARAARR